MKYSQTREILFSTLNVPTRDLVMGAQWPSQFVLTYVKNPVDSLAIDLDPSDYDCLIINHGVEALRDLRMMGIATPILSLISGKDASARITSLQAGADDCMGPVFSVSELVARVQALCRRTNGLDRREQARESTVSVSIKTQTASVGGKSVCLTQTESLILRLFLENQDRLLATGQVSRHVWGADFGASKNLICVHIANLRRKMDTLPWPYPIRTIRGGGYILSSK